MMREESLDEGEPERTDRGAARHGDPRRALDRVRVLAPRERQAVSASFHKVRVPAHTDYTITLLRPNGERWTNCTPYVYATRAQAQRACDRLNERFRSGRAGVAEVEATAREASTAYQTTLRMPVPTNPGLKP